jgi:transglutaminase-like putative cysteine protease
MTLGMRRLVATEGALALALLAHVDHFPIWVSGTVGLALAARLLAEARGLGLPGGALRAVLAIVVTAAVLVSYRTLNGVEAGTAMLALMAALKLSETRTPRDHAVLVFIGYFLCLASLLYQQSMLRFVHALLVCWLLTIALATSQRRIEEDARPPTGTLTLRIVLLGLPFALVLFLFVPRLEGRFWALPSNDTRHQTGISEEMSPGDVSELSKSDAPAFRVWFEGDPPSREQRYFRAIVLEDFDGRTWRRGAGASDWHAPEVVPADIPIGYRITLEPTERAWLVGLDRVVEWPRELAVETQNGQLIRVNRETQSPMPVIAPFTYSLRSSLRQKPSGVALSARDLSRVLRLPREGAPRTRALAAELRAAASDERDFVARVLVHLKEQHFGYTLEPPPLGREPTDEFLFGTRAGFCEHFASAFAVLMRAGGVPARIIAGYLGGERNPYGGYLLVRQSTAHAWTEVWLAPDGWLRIDPTAVIAPQRLSGGLAEALPEESVPGRLVAEWPWLGTARAMLDAVRTGWQENVVGFSTRTQAELLKRLGLSKAGIAGFAIALGAGLLAAGLWLAALAALALRRPRADAALRLWLRFCARLARAGLPRRPSEGPLDYARRVASERPDLSAGVSEIASLYAAVRYLPGAGEAERERLQQLIAAFRPTISGRT